MRLTRLHFHLQAFQKNFPIYLHQWIASPVIYMHTRFDSPAERRITHLHCGAKLEIIVSDIAVCKKRLPRPV